MNHVTGDARKRHDDPAPCPACRATAIANANLRDEVERLRTGIEEIAKRFDGLMSFEGGGTEDELRDLIRRPS